MVGEELDEGEGFRKGERRWGDEELDERERVRALYFLVRCFRRVEAKKVKK